jgi:hypothetical protein
LVQQVAGINGVGVKGRKQIQCLQHFDAGRQRGRLELDADFFSQA